MKIAILGFGREGRSVLKFLTHFPELKKFPVAILDRARTPNYLKRLASYSLVFRSPGVPYNLPELRDARKKGVLFSSATKIFLNVCPAKNIIGITGTKGKGTTATILYHILKAAGKDAHLAGNIGKPAIDILPRLTRNSIVILELSSFQLQDLATSPHIAAILDVFPDHQDSHLNLREYYEAKANIGRYQKRSDAIFFFADNAKSRALAKKSPAKKIGVHYKRFLPLISENHRLPGLHNVKNAAMAAAIARQLAIPQAIILKAIRKFSGVEHRLEYAGTVGKVAFYNDSASTNPHTIAAAIRAFPQEQKVLIAGGQDKNLDYAPLARALKHSRTALIVLMGENKKKIKEAAARAGVRTMTASGLTSAVRTAYAAARRHMALVLFSPGAASFDMFKNYADRGVRFKKVVKRLKTR